VEIEKSGLVTVVVTALTSVALMVGPYRIVPGTGVPNPLGNPALSAAKEKELRRSLVHKALEALQTDVTEQTLFPLN
jgi:glycine reductase complex component B subunit gamma